MPPCREHPQPLHTHTLHGGFALGAAEQPLLMHNVNCSLKRRHFKVHTAGCHPSPSPLHTSALPARLPPLHWSKGVRGGSERHRRDPTGAACNSVPSFDSLCRKLLTRLWLLCIFSKEERLLGTRTRPMINACRPRSFSSLFFFSKGGLLTPKLLSFQKDFL